MARGRGAEKVIVDTFIVVQQRVGVCIKCGARYMGRKITISCVKCKIQINTTNVNCDRRIPTGQWTFFKENVNREESDEGNS